MSQSFRHRVVIVEDSPLIALDLQQILVECGFDVVATFADAARTLEFIELEPFDFALLDYQLEDGTAHELAARLRSKNIPFALCTASSPNNFGDGFVGAPIIEKPFNPEDVCKVVASLL